MNRDTPKQDKEQLPTLGVIIQIIHQSLAQKIQNSIPHSHGEWASAVLASIGISFGLLGWYYFWREYDFYRRTHVKAH